MKETEKIDLLLRGIYEQNKHVDVCELSVIADNAGLNLNRTELNRIADRLENDGYITGRADDNVDICCWITSRGVEYCEGDSYTYRGQSLITNHYNISVNGSSNTSIVQNSENVNVTNNSDVSKIISELRCALESTQSIESAKKNEMIECIEELETVVKSGKTPKASFTYLLSMASDIATMSPVIYGLVKTLGQSIGITLP